MPFEHPYEQLDGGGAPAGRPRRRVPRIPVVVGLTALFGLGGAGVALALGGGATSSASLSSSTSSTTVAKPAVRPHLKGGGALGLGGFGGLGGNVVHGEYTVKTGSTYQTLEVQVGQVQSVSSSSITVKSADGFSQSYVVQASTVVDSQSGGISAVANKDTVRIQALVKGSTHTATDIVDTTKIGASRQGFGFGMGPGRGAGPQGRPFQPPGSSSSTA